jgi:hypothetical protein
VALDVGGLEDVVPVASDAPVDPAGRHDLPGAVSVGVLGHEVMHTHAERQCPVARSTGMPKPDARHEMDA